MRLIATRPVLYLARQYGVGDELPSKDPSMVEAWLTAGSAVWKDENEQVPPAAPKTKAVPETAEPGLPGRPATTDGGEIALVGKVPRRGRKG